MTSSSCTKNLQPWYVIICLIDALVEVSLFSIKTEDLPPVISTSALTIKHITKFPIIDKTFAVKICQESYSKPYKFQIFYIKQYLTYKYHNHTKIKPSVEAFETRGYQLQHYSHDGSRAYIWNQREKEWEKYMNSPPFAVCKCWWVHQYQNLEK